MQGFGRMQPVHNAERQSLQVLYSLHKFAPREAYSHVSSSHPAAVIMCVYCSMTTHACYDCLLVHQNIVLCAMMQLSQLKT